MVADAELLDPRRVHHEHFMPPAAQHVVNAPGLTTRLDGDPRRRRFRPEQVLEASKGRGGPTLHDLAVRHLTESNLPSCQIQSYITHGQPLLGPHHLRLRTRGGAGSERYRRQVGLSFLFRTSTNLGIENGAARSRDETGVRGGAADRSHDRDSVGGRLIPSIGG